MRAFYLFFLGKLVATLINYHKLYHTTHNLLHHTAGRIMKRDFAPKMNICVYDYSYLHLNTLDYVDLRVNSIEIDKENDREKENSATGGEKAQI
jgi:hypothetical protein